MAPTSKPTDLKRVEQLFNFLQGVVPDGYNMPAEDVPHLTADQAWTVIWYLSEQYWQVPDYIQRCDVCGILYDSRCEGAVLAYGDPPNVFCGECEYSLEYEKKEQMAPGCR